MIINKNIQTISASYHPESLQAPCNHANATSEPGFFLRVPYELINHFVLGHHLKRQRELAVFLKLKIHFHNSIIYNPRNTTSLSQRTGISASCLRKYLKIFIDNGWCVILPSGSLRLGEMVNISVSEGVIDAKPGSKYFRVWKNKKTKVLHVKKKYSVSDILNEIRLQVIIKKKKSFEHYKSIVRDCKLSTKRLSKRELSIWKSKMKAKARYNLDDKNFTLDTDYQTSLKTIARNIGRMSKSTACRLMKLAQVNERIKIISGKMIPIPSLGIKNELPQNHFIFLNSVFKRGRNQYVFL